MDMDTNTYVHKDKLHNASLNDEMDSMEWSLNWGYKSGKQIQLSSSFCFAVPPWLTKVTHRIYEESKLFPSAINHVLINEYLPDQGIMVGTKLKVIIVQ